MQASTGQISLTGRLYMDRRPAVVVMGGIWPPKDQFHEFIDWFRGVSVLVAPLPGMAGSMTKHFRVLEFSETLGEVIDHLLPTAPIVLCGASTGALVTLNLRHERIVRHVAIEPFFRTGPLWPVRKFVQQCWREHPPNPGADLAAEQIFGIRPDDCTDRDYRAVLDRLTTPADVVLGSRPLEVEHSLGQPWPSLCSVEDRELLAAHPYVTLHHASPQSGHRQDAPENLALIRKLLHEGLRKAAAVVGRAA